MNFKTTFLLMLMISALLVACHDDLENLDSVQDVKIEETENIDFLKEQFACALAKVLENSKSARDLIKFEALKQFDYDYDVLYALIEDKIVEKNSTFKQLMLQYMNEDNLKILLRKIPTLTIFVPSLPEDSFSAESWNTSNISPCVAYSDMYHNIYAINSDAYKELIPYNIIPLSPIVFIKPSERVSLKSTITRSIPSDDLILTPDGTYCFDYSEFNNLKAEGITRSRSRSPRGDSTRDGTETSRRRSTAPIENEISDEMVERMNKIFEAKDLADKNDIWQRDYVYYNITTKDDKGPFQRNVSECLYSFELLGDPQNMYNLICDQSGDPNYIEGVSLLGRRDNKPTGWTEGNLEFIIKIYVSNNQLVSNEIVKALSISPTKLFDLKTKNGRGLVVCGVEGLTRYILPEPLPLWDWNIENYSASVKISIEEKDASETVQNVLETTTTFATNFGFDVGLGETVKIGAKFGASQSLQSKASTTVTRSLESDELGDVIINFSDDVITDTLSVHIDNSPRRVGIPEPSPRYSVPLNPKYISGYYKIEIMPLPMY